MADQVFIFGTFSEDEARNLLNQSVKKPEEEKGLPLDSSSKVTGLSFGSFDAEFSFKVPLSNGLDSSRSSEICKNIESKNVKKLDSVSGGKLKENGHVNSSVHCSPVSNGSVEPEIVSEKTECKLDPPEKFHNLRLQDHGKVSLNCEPVNGISHVVLQKHYASDGPNKTLEDLQPRGLINSWNLCFLNATLRALLSCSQLVKLLLELRNRNISKVLEITPQHDDKQVEVTLRSLSLSVVQLKGIGFHYMNLERSGGLLSCVYGDPSSCSSYMTYSGSTHRRKTTPASAINFTPLFFEPP